MLLSSIALCDVRTRSKWRRVRFTVVGHTVAKVESKSHLAPVWCCWQEHPVLDRLSGMNQGGQAWAVACTVKLNWKMSKKDQVAFILLTSDQQFQMANMYTCPTLYTYSAAYILHWCYIICPLLSLIGKVNIKFPLRLMIYCSLEFPVGY